MSHLACPVPLCEGRAGVGKLMCRPCWARVPRDVRLAVLAHYKPGQTAHTATPKYLEAMRAAVKCADELRAEKRS